VGLQNNIQVRQLNINEMDTLTSCIEFSAGIPPLKIFRGGGGVGKGGSKYFLGKTDLRYRFLVTQIGEPTAVGCLRDGFIISHIRIKWGWFGGFEVCFVCSWCCWCCCDWCFCCLGGWC